MRRLKSWQVLGCKITGTTKTNTKHYTTSYHIITHHNIKTDQDTPSHQSVPAELAQNKGQFSFFHQRWWVLFTQTSHHNATSYIANKTAPGKNLQPPQDPHEKKAGRKASKPELRPPQAATQAGH
jgi:hypothetical protein